MVKDNTIYSRIFNIANLVILSLMTLLCVLPIWYTLCISLSDKAAVAGGLVTFWPVKITINSYGRIIGDIRYFDAIKVSVMRVVLADIINFVIILLTAYPLSKSSKDFPKRKIFIWVVVFTMLFNGGIIPWYLTIKTLGMLDSIWALVLGGSLNTFNVILVMNFFRNLPRELDEAAVVDGAGPWYILFKLFLPLSIPVVATVMLFVTVSHWNDFYEGLVLIQSPSKYPLQTYIQQIVAAVNLQNMSVDQLKTLNALSDKTLNAAEIFVSIIPIMAVYPFFQRYFVSGIMLGSIEG